MNHDSRRINADLHCHSSVSDGVLTPADVVQRAHANGVDMLALTDHDEIDGLAEAAAAAAELGLRFVPGVEISVTWAGETIHVLGLAVDFSHPALVDGIARTRLGRDQRAREIADQLAAAGIPGAYEGARRHVGNPELISRTHFARYIVETGACRDLGEVFTRYLVEGKPGFIAHRWATLGEALDWIRASGGAAVIAHPGRYRLDRTALHALLAEFSDRGGQALEVVCGSHEVHQYREFEQYAIEFGFRASRGSDFHGPGESRVELGALPPLPDSLVPVWRDWH